MLKQFKSIYRALPPWLTVPVRYIPDGILFGKSYRRCVPRTDTDCLGENIKRALDYVRKHTAWGRETIPEKIVAEEAEGVLSELPTIGSEDLNADSARFVSDEATRFNSYWSTTGMTKIPTSVYLANSAYGLEWAHMLHIWRLGGYCRRRDCKLTFRGNRFGEGELVRRDPIYNEVSVDSFQVTDKTFGRFFDLVKKERISCIHGYPTLIKMFMDRLVAIGEKFPVREIMLASEGASVELKKELRDFFGARVLSWYGLTEKVVLAYDEFADGRFVNFTSYGYPRVINPDKNGIGEIVGTTFVNFAMPLVNYRTGDCGRIVRDGDRMYIENLDGRSNKDFIYETPEIKYAVTAIDVPSEVYHKMLYFQVIQNRYAELEVLLLLRNEWRNEGSRLLEMMRLSIEKDLPHFRISVRLATSADELNRSGRGKFRKLVQNIQCADKRIEEKRPIVVGEKNSRSQTVAVIGGGASAHLLSVLLARQGHHVRIFSSRPREWNCNLELELPDGTILHGEVDGISSDANAILDGAGVAFLCMPVHQYPNALDSLMPALSRNKNCIVGSIYGQGGVDWMVNDVCRKAGIDTVRHFAIGLLPWIARTKIYGKRGISYGPKLRNGIACSDDSTYEFLQENLLPDLSYSHWGCGAFERVPNFLTLTLTVDNQIIHPSRCYALAQEFGAWATLDEIPYFYRDFDDLSTEVLKGVDNDYSLVRKAIADKVPNFDNPYNLNYLDLEHWSYGSNNPDIKSSFVNSSTLKAIKPPTVKCNDGRWRLNPDHRFFMDDFSYGLEICKWFADKLNCSVPYVERLIGWYEKEILPCQKERVADTKKWLDNMPINPMGGGGVNM